MIKSVNYHQKGQALPLGLAFLMGAVLFGVTMFNTGQLASEKTRLANAADAAVYSGLIWQARALNFQAYTNRAMVANQVAIGQLLSVASWTKYGAITARNIDNFANLFPPAKAYTTPAKSYMDQIDDGVVNMVETFIPLVDTLNGVLSTAQKAIYLSSFAATPSIVKEVVDRNDGRYRVNSAYAIVGQGINSFAWRGLSARYEDREGLLRKANVIRGSKDDFTKRRNVSHSDLLAGAPKVELGLFRAWLTKEGGTRLVVKASEDNSFNFGGVVNDRSGLEWEWKGKDTFSLHIRKFKCSWRRGCGWRKSEIPIGWGSRYLNGDFECKTEENYWGQKKTTCVPYMRKNKKAEKRADGENEAVDINYEGVRAYYDLKNLSRENRDPRLVLRLEVQTSENKVRTSAKINGSAAPEESRNGLGKGLFRQEDNMLENVMSSISSGEVYFHPPDDYRPDRRGGKIEIANLFSPYWEVRLIKTPLSERMAAWGLRDLDFLSTGVGGISAGVNAGINAVESDLSSAVAQNIKTAATTGITAVSRVPLAKYQKELDRVQDQYSSSARKFEEQFVDQVKSQVERGAVDSAVSSFGF